MKDYMTLGYFRNLPAPTIAMSTAVVKNFLFEHAVAMIKI